MIKKRILTILLCTIFALTISGCTKNKKINENFEPTEIDGISMTIKRNSLTNNEATVIIKDTNGKGTYVYGSGFRIDKKEDNDWVRPKETGKKLRIRFNGLLCQRRRNIRNETKLGMYVWNP